MSQKISRRGFLEDLLKGTAKVAAGVGLYGAVSNAYGQELMSSAQRARLLKKEIRQLISKNGAKLYKATEGTFDEDTIKEALSKGGNIYVPVYAGGDENLPTFKNHVSNNSTLGYQAYPSLTDARLATGYNVKEGDNVIAAQRGRCGYSYFVFSVRSKRLTDIIAPTGSSRLR